jgi:hypothetical protein
MWFKIWSPQKNNYVSVHTILYAQEYAQEYDHFKSILSNAEPIVLSEDENLHFQCFISEKLDRVGITFFPQIIFIQPFQSILCVLNKLH